MLIGGIEYARVTITGPSGEIIAEISDSVTEELDGYQINMEMACEAVGG